MRNLGTKLSEIYDRTGKLKDLQDSIDLARTVLESIPESDLGWLSTQNNLAVRLLKRYVRLENEEDLEASLATADRVAAATPEDDPAWVSRHANLSVQLGHQYYQTGRLEDLEKAINVAQRFAKSIPKDHTDRALCLRGLGIRLNDRYLRTGKLDDLNEAIRVGREAESITPKDEGDLPTLWSNLGMCLGNRYSRTGLMEDLDNAIGIIRQAIDKLQAMTANSEAHFDMAGLENNLGLLLGKKYARTKTKEILDEAISAAQKSVQAVAENHIGRPLLLNNLGLRLGERFLLENRVQDLDEAVKLSRQAVEATRDHPYRAGWFVNHRNLLDERYAHTQLELDREKAIQVSRDAMNATSLDDPARCALLKGFGDQLLNRYRQGKKAEDFSEAMECFRTALHQETSPISDRIAAGRQLLLSPTTMEESPSLDIDKAAEATINLVTFLAPKSLQITDKQFLLWQVVGFASDAAAVALAVGKGPIEAIARLEKGRGILASSLQDLRTDLSLLKQKHPELERSFIDIRDTLDGSYQTDLLARVTDESTQVFQTKVDERHEADKQMLLLLEDIRAKAGFERFLLPLSEAEMRKAASQGPIIIINISIFRCDALIIEESDIKAVPLVRLARQDVLNRSSRPRSLETLAWLWDDIVNPVFEALGLNKSPSEDSLKHIWWIPTGPLVGFPLHAAGYHLEPGFNTALDRAISSYSSTIKTIVHSREQPIQEMPATGRGQAVVIAMPQTPGQNPLSNAEDERKEVHRICIEMGLHSVPLQPFRDEVLSALQDCKVFHFAGHGNSCQGDPLQSHLPLQDWEESPLTVERMMGTNVGSRSPLLAYLSACRTGQIRHEASVDESIHLMTAFQLAGFRHVVGTLWEVDDEQCVSIAKSMYEFLQKNGIRDSSVSSGLHQALRESRDEWVKSVQHRRSSNVEDGRDIQGLAGSEALDIPPWVPYVHYGV
ncbi:CHAT domain-containing protein [Ilyonectria robusta]|uniref:CHAT domain-containing protein n=1 Tax=Ilyonectria robusta TaxID=1079257 RepID=UPI001E8ECCE1|nr:CHAT domain-containing protein [Ilyonectria robusta]KAH8686258.1 CHAT domain-containing protein [Ilyonectria robusta]